MTLFRECQQLNLRLAECPSFLFMVMGIITVAAVIATYFITSEYAGPEIVIIAVSSVTMITFTIGHFVVSSISRIVQIHQMQSEFVSIASHQLRTPLSSMKWSLEALSKTNLSPQQLNYAQMLQESEGRMLKLVNDLLNVAQIEQGRLKFKKEKFKIDELINELIKEFKLFSQAHNAKITFQKTSAGSLWGDREKIKMVLENLINNAIQYNGKNIIIRLDKNTISVQDDGIGILQIQQKRVFQKFFRAQNIMQRQTQGTGLGLFIAKAIIEAHQGKIWFESQENKGTTFFYRYH